jgi:hypothetical protein
MNIAIGIKVGYLKKSIIDLLGVKLKPGEIKLLPGGIKHIRKKRKKFFNNYFNKIPNIIKNPDYVGTNLKYPNSIEFVKKLEENILVVVRLHKSNILCVATMFEVTEAKILHMLKYGRIRKV